MIRRNDLFVGLIGLAVAFVIAINPVVGLASAFAVFGAGFALHRKGDVATGLASLFFLLVLIPELAAVRPAISVFGSSIYVPHLIGLALLPFARFSLLQSWARFSLLGYSGLTMFMSVWGLLLNAPLAAVLQDVRGPLTFLGGAVSGLVLYQRRGLRGLLHLVPLILVTTVGLIGLQSVTGANILGGRVAGAVGFGGVGRAGTAIDATRFIVSSEDLAVAALLVTFWWFTQRRSVQPPRFLMVAVAAMGSIIIVTSLSRQLLVGLAVGAIAWPLVRGGVTKSVRMAIASIPFIMAAVLVLSLLTAVGQGLGSESLVGRQVDGFSERVLGGLTSESISEDAGSNWRQRENAAAIELIGEQPLGTGFGNPYRPQWEVESFGDPTFFRRWVHNVWLWYGTKGGWLGFAAIGLVTVVPFLKAFRRSRASVEGSDPIAEVCVPIFLAFGLMSLVDPVIINSNSGVITGALIALLGLEQRPQFAQSSERSSTISSRNKERLSS